MKRRKIEETEINETLDNMTKPTAHSGYSFPLNDFIAFGARNHETHEPFSGSRMPPISPSSYEEDPELAAVPDALGER